MDRKLMPGTLSGSVPALSSKSHVHRLLICAALSKETCLVRHTQPCDDVLATLECLRTMGAACEPVTGGTLVTGMDTLHVCTDRTLDCGESGSTLRFILPLLATLGGGTCQGRGRLMQRPIAPLAHCLEPHGVQLSIKENTLQVICKDRALMSGGTYHIAANVSSQFVSGLLLALPLAEGDSHIILEGECVSAPYIALTLHVQKAFGITVKETANGFFIPGRQCYQLLPLYNGEIAAEGDWSGAAFFLAAGAVGTSPVGVCGLSPETMQGDGRIVDILRAFGAICKRQGDCTWVTPAPLTALTVDAADIPDLVPILAVVASEAVGDSRFLHVDRLRGKESDRVQGVINLLQSFGKRAYTTEEGDTLVVCGKEAASQRKEIIEVDPMGDHRLAMSAAVAALTANCLTVIHHSECVKKSYPDFFERFYECFTERL